MLAHHCPRRLVRFSPSVVAINKLQMMMLSPFVFRGRRRGPEDEEGHRPMLHNTATPSTTSSHRRSLADRGRRSGGGASALPLIRQPFRVQVMRLTACGHLLRIRFVLTTSAKLVKNHPPPSPRGPLCRGWALVLSARRGPRRRRRHPREPLPRLGQAPLHFEEPCARLV